jgi:hypothetical protein
LEWNELFWFISLKLPSHIPIHHNSSKQASRLTFSAPADISSLCRSFCCVFSHLYCQLCQASTLSIFTPSLNPLNHIACSIYSREAVYSVDGRATGHERREISRIHHNLLPVIGTSCATVNIDNAVHLRRSRVGVETLAAYCFIISLPSFQALLVTLLTFTAIVDNDWGILWEILGEGAARGAIVVEGWS